MAKISTGWLEETINGIRINHSYPCHSSNYDNYSSRTVSYIGIHYTGNQEDSAQANTKYFQSPNRNASAHLFVDDTHIEQSVELRDAAWSIGCRQGYKTNARNANSINIEMCCTAGNYKISEKTQVNTAYLCARICQMLGITANAVDTYVLRHYDCVKSNKQCPKQYVTNPAEWTQFKTWVKNILNTGSHTGSETYVYDGVDFSKVFDHRYYADNNIDLKNAFGYDKGALFNHFINYGCRETSRFGKTISTFNAGIYKDNNADLRNAYGEDLYMYYWHYCVYGYKENRKCI